MALDSIRGHEGDDKSIFATALNKFTLPAAFAGAVAALLNATPASAEESVQGQAGHVEHHEKVAALQTGAVLATNGDFGVNGQFNLGIGNHHGVHLEFAPLSFSVLNDALKATPDGEDHEWTYVIGTELGPIFPLGKYFTIAALAEAGLAVKDLKEKGIETEVEVGGVLKGTAELPGESYVYVSGGPHVSIPLQAGHAEGSTEAHGETSGAHFVPVTVSAGFGIKLF